jgi:hypothetical protein
VLERRPVIMEEVVVRRREVDASELTAADRRKLERERAAGEQPVRERGGQRGEPGERT